MTDNESKTILAFIDRVWPAGGVEPEVMREFGRRIRGREYESVHAVIVDENLARRGKFAPLDRILSRLRVEEERRESGPYEPPEPTGPIWSARQWRAHMCENFMGEDAETRANFLRFHGMSLDPDEFARLAMLHRDDTGEEIERKALAPIGGERERAVA